MVSLGLHVLSGQSASRQAPVGVVSVVGVVPVSSVDPESGVSVFVMIGEQAVPVNASAPAINIAQRACHERAGAGRG